VFRLITPMSNRALVECRFFFYLHALSTVKDFPALANVGVQVRVNRFVVHFGEVVVFKETD
jgi:hypothetical protein